jgi:putative SOS response-associated peptidase YedK
MCYSSSLTSKNVDLSKKYKKEIPSEIAEEPLFHASAFSYPEWRIITAEPEIQVMKWGLIPSWFKGSNTVEISSKTINARSETILEKPSFKHLIGRQHCIIPSTGFFEYQHVGKEKVPYFVHPANDSLFSMAGVFDIYKNPISGNLQKTFSIITCPANEVMAEIHNTKKRMPVMLASDQFENWLHAKPAEIADFLVPSPDNWIAAHKINPKIVSGANHNTADVQILFIDPRGVQGNFEFGA